MYIELDFILDPCWEILKFLKIVVELELKD
jgi:hypothetical protein